MLILLIIIFYNISEKFSDTCDGNCGKYNNSNNKIDTNTEANNCLKCSNCGICTLEDNSRLCTNGVKEGPFFVQNCVKWNYGIDNSNPTPTINNNIINNNNNNDNDNDNDKEQLKNLMIKRIQLINDNINNEFNDLMVQIKQY